ncbi:MAG: tetratricopeptide repeat protein, partial [Planctomycetota bacterium]
MKRLLFIALLVIALGAAGALLWMRDGGGVVELSQAEMDAAKRSGAAAQEIAVESQDEEEAPLPTLEELKEIASREQMEGFAARIREERSSATGEDAALLTVLLSEVERLCGRVESAYDLAVEGAESLPQNSRARHMVAKAILARIMAKADAGDWGALLSMMSEVKAYKAEVNAAVELDPANVDARVGQILTLLLPGFLGNKKRAKELIEEIGEYDPLRREFWNAQVIALDDDRLDEAVTEFERLREAYPEDADILMTLGELYIKQDAWESAIATFDRLNVEPRTPHAYRSLYQGAKARMKAGRDADEALAMLTEFEAANPVGEPMPTMDRVKYHRGRALTKLGRFADAVASLEASLEIKP